MSERVPHVQKKTTTATKDDSHSPSHCVMIMQNKTGPIHEIIGLCVGVPVTRELNWYDSILVHNMRWFLSLFIVSSIKKSQRVASEIDVYAWIVGIYIFYIWLVLR